MKTIYDDNELDIKTAQTTKTTIFYYTGTGNSLWAARVLARKLGNTELISIVDWDIKKHKINSPVIGLVFPVHIWGVPCAKLRVHHKVGGNPTRKGLAKPFYSES